MRVVFILCILLVNSTHLFAQPFSKTFIPAYSGLNYGGGWGRGLVSINDTALLVIGVSSNGNIGTYTAKQNILQLNNAAEVKTQLNIGNDSISLFMMQGEIISKTDSMVILGGTYQWSIGTFPNDTINSRIKLDWYNKYTNAIIRTKQYSCYPNKNDATMYCISNLSNKLLVCGTNVATNNQAFVLCLNDTGLVLWKTFIPTANKSNSAFSSASTPDGGYLISALTDLVRYPKMGSNDSIDAYNTIYKLDSNGTMLWKKVMWRSSHSYNVRIQPDGLGNYYLGNWADTAWEADDKKYNGTLAKIDEHGNIIWQKYFNDEPKAFKAAWDFKTLGNGDVLLIGAVAGGGAYPGERTGWLCRMAPNGTIVWQQYYKSFAATNFGVLCDAVELPNGDLVITGSASDSATNKQAIWLLRTDAFGCLQAGCYPLNTIQIEPIQPFALQAYPNPTSANITLQSNNGSLLQGSVQVYNAQGQIVYSIIQNLASATIQIPLNTQATGLYYVRYTNAINKGVSTLKVLKE